MVRQNRDGELIQAVCFHCGSFNEYYKHPDETPVCQYCGYLLDVEV